jgi:hypothetical protein
MDLCILLTFTCVMRLSILSLYILLPQPYWMLLELYFHQNSWHNASINFSKIEKFSEEPRIENGPKLN